MSALTSEDLTRYHRQLSLPEITPAHQTQLKTTRILAVGAGGLGAASLPYLAGAGIGHITIADADTVSIPNLHRQTLYTEAQQGQNKAELSAVYLRALNPLIEIIALPQRITADSKLPNCDLILDGSDNFTTKQLLNEISIRTKTPLLTASVEQWNASFGLFNGGIDNAPCYSCLFPETPENARNCNDAGILGTTAGLAGLYQAHMALCFLLGIGEINLGTILSCDLKNMRLQRLKLDADPACTACSKTNRNLASWRKPGSISPEEKIKMRAIELLSLGALQKTDHIIIDVREAYELIADPIPNALHIPLPELATRADEIPNDKLIALVCAGNVRSHKGAEMLQAFGYKNVCVLDKFSL